MQYRWSNGMLALTVGVLGVSLTACTQDNASEEEGATAATAESMESEIPRLLGNPDFNGIWRAINSANWNLEAHSAEALEDFWQMGALAAIPAGQSVVVGGEIPYLPEALEVREEHRANWPGSDPETSCYLPGIPRATYMPHNFQIFQGDGDILFVYEYHATNRLISMTDREEAPVDTWMGQGNGTWDGDTLVIETHAQNGKAHLDRAGNHYSRNAIVEERFTLMDKDHIWYEATITDPSTFAEPWTIEMPLYRIIDEDAQLLEFNCVPFAEDYLYQDLIIEGAE